MLVVVFVGRSFIPNGNLYRVLKNSNARSFFSLFLIFALTYFFSLPPPLPSLPLPPSPHLALIVCSFLRSSYLFLIQYLFLILILSFTFSHVHSSFSALSHALPRILSRTLPAPPQFSYLSISISTWPPTLTPVLINNPQVSVWFGSTHCTKHWILLPYNL